MWKQIFARFRKRRRNAWRVDCHSLEWARLTRLDGITFRLVRYFMSADIWSRRGDFFASRRRKIPAGPSRSTAWGAVTLRKKKRKRRGRGSNGPLKPRRGIQLRRQNPLKNQA